MTSVCPVFAPRRTERDQNAMPECDYCGTTIIFGGVKDHGLHFCSDKCHQQGVLHDVTDQIPEEVISEYLMEVHEGACPICNGPGPVDVHTSYVVWSALVITSWKSKPQVSCRRCGIKAKVGNACLSGLVGWWGFPWGIVMTPVQLLRNFFGIFSSPDPTMPSEQLENILKAHLAAQLAAESYQEEPDE